MSETVSWMCAIPLMLAMRTSQCVQRTLEIGARGRLVPLAEQRGRIDVAPAEELREHFGAALAERFLRDPGILAPDLALVFVEPHARRAKDRQIDVDQRFGICALGLDGVSREQDEIGD